MNENIHKTGTKVSYDFVSPHGRKTGQGVVGARKPSGRVEVKIEGGKTLSMWPSQMKAA